MITTITQMPVQTCDAYPGSKLSKVSNEESGSDCSCVADPGAHSAKKAFSCPPDMVLKFDDVADQSTGVVVPQYHCTKQQTETVKTSQPLQCQPGWTAETVNGKGSCTITTTKCDPNEVIDDLHTEFGILSAPKDCHCKKKGCCAASFGADLPDDLDGLATIAVLGALELV